MRIYKVKIKNFRSIKEVEISSIDNALILIGKNNAGKSAILSAIGVFFGEKQPKQSDFHKGKTDKNIEIGITFYITDNDLDSLIFDGTYGISKIPNASLFRELVEKLSIEHLTGKTLRGIRSELDDAIKNRDVNFLKGHPFYIVWQEALKEKLGILNGDKRIHTLTIILEISKQDSGDPKPRYTTNNGAELKQPQLKRFLPKLVFITDERNFSEEEQAKRNTWTEKLAKLYWESVSESISQKEQELQDELESMMKRFSEEVNRFFKKHYGEYSDHSIELIPEVDIRKAVNVRVKIQLPGLLEKVPLSNVGAGVRSMCLISLLEAYLKLSKIQDVIFVFEEPEIYLHPELQKKMAQILYELSLRNQIMFSTHSTLLLRHFDIWNIKHVYLNSNGETNIKDAKFDEILSDLGYSIADIIQKQFVIIVEGKDDTRRLSAILSKFTGWSKREVKRRIYFLEANGSKGIRAYATLKFMGMTEFRGNFAIIRDSDTIPPEKIESELVNAYHQNVGIGKTKLRKHILVLRYSALDNYFVDYKVLMGLGIISSKGEYVELLRKFVHENKDSIEKYWQEKNLDDRVIERYRSDLFSKNITSEDFIESCKRLIRAHDLYNYLWHELIENSEELKRKFRNKENYDLIYVENSSWNTFKDILEFLKNLDYFRPHLIRESRLDEIITEFTESAHP